tara:strand:- start:4726 stop:4857 length:132 start_codon:yes stop_codon:yes gene_type:complete
MGILIGPAGCEIEIIIIVKCLNEALSREKFEYHAIDALPFAAE